MPKRTTSISAQLPWGLHWFRRDLRIQGNPAMEKARQSNDGRVLGFFCFDPTFLSRPDFSWDRFAFFLQTLGALKTELRQAGGDLLVVNGGPDEALRRLWSTLREEKVPLPVTLSFNRDYEPFARNRDSRICDAVREELGEKTEILSERDHLLIEPEEIQKATGGPGSFYSVYTPFSKRWLELFRTREVSARIDAQSEALSALTKASLEKKISPSFRLTWDELFSRGCPLEDALEDFAERTKKRSTLSLPPAGSASAYRRLLEFSEISENYTVDRDRLALDATSGLSLYLKNGSISSSLVLYHLRSNPAPLQFLKELIWREFFYHVLWHRPDVENQAFNPRYRQIVWEHDERKFEAWKKGETGYPVVDAAMRQLASTGRMHNRARMIVASFLTKDLLIDWRWGERYFMEKLLDGDLAANNGGWQWAAGTGCDAQPYFRIFNPESQSRKFDPSGDYIRRYIPELRHLSDTEIHRPPPTRGYPLPIVQHAERRLAALRIYKDSAKNTVQ